MGLALRDNLNRSPGDGNGGVAWLGPSGDFRGQANSPNSARWVFTTQKNRHSHKKLSSCWMAAIQLHNQNISKLKILQSALESISVWFRNIRKMQHFILSFWPRIWNLVHYAIGILVSCIPFLSAVIHRNLWPVGPVSEPRSNRLSTWNYLMLGWKHQGESVDLIRIPRTKTYEYTIIYIYVLRGKELDTTYFFLERC